MNAWDIYEDLTNLAAVRTYIENQMDEYNASTGVVRMNLILFRDAVEHICRIVRVISQVSTFDLIIIIDIYWIDSNSFGAYIIHSILFINWIFFCLKIE